MARELSRAFARLSIVGSMVVLGGCSLTLDFSDSQIPKDAAPDGPFPAAACAFGEPNDTPATAFMIAAGSSGPGAICPAPPGGSDDLDYFKFTVPDDDDTVTILVSFTITSTGDLDLRLFGSDGSDQLAQSRGFGDNEMITCPGTEPSCAQLTAGDYLFEVFPATSGQTNDYDLDLTITPGSGSGGSGSGSGSA